MVQEILTYIIVAFAFGYVIFKFVRYLYRIIANKETGCTSCSSGSSACSACNSASCSGCPFAGKFNSGKFNFENYKNKL